MNLTLLGTLNKSTLEFVERQIEQASFASFLLFFELALDFSRKYLISILGL
jgi:hypothetical protein